MTSPERTSISPRSWAFGVGLAFSVSFGLLDTLACLLHTDLATLRYSNLLEALAAAVVVFLALYLLLWSLLALVLKATARFYAPALAVGLALSLSAMIVLSHEDKLLEFPFSGKFILRCAVILFVAALLFVTGYFSSRGVAQGTERDMRRTTLVLSILLLSLWLVMLAVYSYRNRQIPQLVLLLLGVYLLIQIATIFLVYSFGTGWKSLGWLGVFAFLIVGSPFVFRLQKRDANLPAPTSRNHAIKHVLLLTVDTLRADALSCYGNKMTETRNIDSLQENGLLFQNAFSDAPWTLPSFCSIMTGVSPQVHLAWKADSELPARLPRLAQYMYDSGYRTAAIGDNYFLKKNSLSRGFMEYNVFPQPKLKTFGYFLLEYLFSEPPEFIDTSYVTNLATEWLDTHRNEDFFLWVHYFDPHLPYDPPPQFLPKKEAPSRIGNHVDGPMIASIWQGFFVPSIEERDWIRGLYSSEVRYVDDSIGQIFQTLRKLNLYDSTLIVFSSDHGDEFWEHGRMGHGHTVYNELLRVPLIIKLPGSTNKATVQERVSTVDVMPTILDSCGIHYDRNLLTGHSLSETGNGKNAETDQTIVSTGLLYYEDRVSVIFDHYKYIKNLVSNHEELYDLLADPQEQNSIIDAFPQIAEKGRSLLSQQESEALRIRKHYGITDPNRTEMNDEMRENIRALGYIQ